MKVLMTADPIGGVWTYALQLARALGDAGIDVELATMGAPLTVAQQTDAQRCGNVTLHQSSFALEWMDEPWIDVARAGEWLLEIAHRTRPDVVHLNNFVHGALPWPAPRLVVAHSCVLTWWRAVHTTTAPPGWQRYQAQVERGLTAADRIVTPTRAFLYQLREHYHFDTPTAVIPNGCDATEPAPGKDECAVFAPVVLAAGRLWDEAKNMKTLARAARHIAVPVFAAGSNHHPNGQRRVPRGLRALGPLATHSMQRWYRRADIFVHPAVYEPFGLAPLEAALAGAALVLSDIATLREVWSDATVYVPARDAHALANAVNELIHDPVLRAERASAARQRAHQFTAQRCARAYAELYRGMVTQHATAEVLACVS